MVDRRARAWTGICPALLACAVVPACTRVSDTDRFPVRDEVLRIVETVPRQGERDVDPDARLDLCLSATVDPRSVSTVDATVSSGESIVDSELSLEILPWTGPGGTPLPADAAAPWCAKSVLAIGPKAALQAELLYRARLVPRARGWDGEALDTEQDGWVPEGGSARYYLEFTVAEAGPLPGSGSGSDSDSDSDSDSGSGSGSGSDSGAGGERVGVTLSELFGEGNVFDPARSTCSCHREPEELGFARLDLSDAATAYADLVLESRSRDTGFPMVSPRLPSESFLVHKLLRDEHGEALRGVLGDAMPPDEPLAYADYVAIARWIEDGAQP